MMSFGSVSRARTSSQVTIRLPSGVEARQRLDPRAGGEDHVGRLEDAVAALAGRAVLAGLADADLVRALEAAAALDPGDLVLVDQGLEAGPQPLHDLVAAGGHLGVVDARARRRASGRSPWRAGRARRTRPIRAAPSSGCSRGGGTSRRSCPRRRGRPSGRAGPPGTRRCSRRCPRRGRRDRSRWRSRRPWGQCASGAADRARRAAGWAVDHRGDGTRAFGTPQPSRRRRRRRRAASAPVAAALGSAEHDGRHRRSSCAISRSSSVGYLVRIHPGRRARRAG